MGLRRIRLYLQRPPVARNGTVELPEILQHASKREFRIGKIRLYVKCPAIRGQCSVALA